MQAHQLANENYFDDGVRLVELSRRAKQLFLKQDASSRRKLLDLVLSNCTWHNGELTVAFREPFDIIVDMAAQVVREEPSELAPSPDREGWLGGRESNPDMLVQSQLSYH